jgi:UDP-3-O-[3-hydroxymyristoyl] glucosamine N-acyltransferase
LTAQPGSRLTVAELARRLGATLVAGAGTGSQAVTGVAPIAQAKAGDLTFVASPDFARHVATTAATAVLLKEAVPGLKAAQLVHRNPYFAFAKAAQLFHPPRHESPGHSPKAHVEPGAVVAPSATLYPFAYVGARARIGERAVLYPGVYVGADAVIGEGTVLRANVVVENGVTVGSRVLVHGGAVLGADGFGFAPGEGELAKIPQIGKVVIADDVEIGGLTTVDRGALEDTRVGRGTKLDSHVHIGHGAVLGERCMMCGQSGLAGSAKLGDGVIVGGGAAVDNRCELAPGVVVGAVSAVTKDLPDPGVYLGFPAMPAGEFRRMTARMRRLGELEDRVKALEAALAGAKP